MTTDHSAESTSQPAPTAREDENTERTVREAVVWGYGRKDGASSLMIAAAFEDMGWNVTLRSLDAADDLDAPDDEDLWSGLHVLSDDDSLSVGDVRRGWYDYAEKVRTLISRASEGHIELLGISLGSLLIAESIVDSCVVPADEEVGLQKVQWIHGRTRYLPVTLRETVDVDRLHSAGAIVRACHSGAARAFSLPRENIYGLLCRPEMRVSDILEAVDARLEGEAHRQASEEISEIVKSAYLCQPKMFSDSLRYTGLKV